MDQKEICQDIIGEKIQQRQTSYNILARNDMSDNTFLSFVKMLCLKKYCITLSRSLILLFIINHLLWRCSCFLRFSYNDVY